MQKPSETKEAQPAQESPQIRQDDAAAERPFRRRRMAAEDREELILREATVYFAEHGLNAGTIELAQRIGITQPLLYKYFPTKDALIERIYERLIPQNWNPVWELLLDDDSIPLRERLRQFYYEYATSVLTYVHVRLFLFSGLSRNDFNTRYYDVLSKRILERIARAVRREFGSKKSSRSVSKGELELVQSLHAAIYHVAYRRWVHEEQMKFDMAELVRMKVDFYLDGAERSFQRLEFDRPARGGRKESQS